MMIRHYSFVLSSFKHLIKLHDNVIALIKLAVTYSVTNTVIALSIDSDAQHSSSDLTNHKSSHN